MATHTGKSANAYILQPHEGEALDAIGLRLLATKDLTGGRLFAAACVNPGTGGPPLHTHYAHDEFYLVLRGLYRFRIEGRDQDGGPGTFAYVPRGTSHTFANIGPDEGRLLAGSLPSLEDFLRRMTRLGDRDASQKEYVKLFADFDSRIDGPPLFG
jgi:mannose-6-phosphate isomerase-like protein (cupin superfamily)